MFESALNQAGILGLGFSASPPLLGQIVNVGFGPAGILGLCIAGAGAGLYLLRSMRPELARDYDIFFSAIGLLCGGILFFNGWRLDPILMFGQVLMAGSAVFFAFESIRLRAIATDQAKRGVPMVDDERSYSVDRVYRAELDEIEPYMDERPPMRRIRGVRDGSTSSRDAYDDTAYGSAYGSGSNEGRSSRRSARRSSRSSRSNYDSTSESDPRYGDSSGYSAGSSSSRGRSRGSYEAGASRTRPESRSSGGSYPARRSSSNRDRYYEDEPPAPTSRRRSPSNNREDRRYSGDDYVDYKPISDYSVGETSRRSRRGGGSSSSDYDDEWGAS
ncbi:Ycf66 family protein [Lyngbya confervoides]|uniref:Ycf66 family protein n=1 Tax=Lyngbya confervoides BDU141951 TaxID=1574623 RepID=A0ABD4T8G1_9CYAN|nr:Ycf66 family protein [Lyngbya confervoides]MCM1985082.1 Ycf66 family protein [Lyngbya confervoides BDU141951]